MTQQIQRFIDEDTGAVSVDWLVLTAAVVSLGFMAVSAVQDGVSALGTSMLDAVATQSDTGSGL